ncbi:HNH endonuclease [Tritonibacter horizontis]|uniref:HNH endonuclease n=1 Tax=Tritonibacter horizontis TaxID=1768241 RepID=A0A132BTS9_9RHOB|nr:HNH endonuclease signature motif containing protein [Tritonibacter horizontis]KUP91789.1 HNH endonuclease [Tritonibacter horizontis]
MTARSEYHHLYNKSAWRRQLRPQHLAREPLCRACLRRGIINDGSLTAAGEDQANARRRFLVVDHVIPHRGDLGLFLDPANLQTLCPDDHDQNKQRLEARGYSQERGADGWPIDPQHPANR